jgi:hypothetical protein
LTNASTPSEGAESATPGPAQTDTSAPSADLTACGSPVDVPEVDGLWVGDYGGGIGVPASAPLAAPLELPLSVILEQDLGGQQIGVTPSQAYLLSTTQTPGVVVAVIGAPLPGTANADLTSGSEGNGGGSEGRVVLPLTFTGCTGSLAPGWYQAVTEVEISGAIPTVTTWGRVPVLVEN